MCVNRGALFVSPTSIDSFGKRDTREGEGKMEGCFYFFSFHFCSYYNFCSHFSTPLLFFIETRKDTILYVYQESIINNRKI